MRFCSIVILTGLVAAPVAAQTAALPAAPAKAKTVCRSSFITGSRMATRSCHTAKEWDDIDSGKQRNIDKANLNLLNTSKVQSDHVGTPSF